MTLANGTTTAVAPAEAKPAKTDKDPALEPNPTRPGDSTTGQKAALAVPGLATGKGKAPLPKIDFVPFWTEARVWSDDVKKAMVDHPAHLKAIDAALDRIAGLDIPTDKKESLGKDLIAVRADLTELLAGRIPADKRAAAISTINAAPARVKTVEDGAAAAEQAKRLEDQKQREALEAKRKKEAIEAQAIEDKKKADEEKKRAEEDKRQQDEQAAAKAIEDKKKADEDAAAKALADKKKQADDAAEALRREQEAAAAAALKKQQAALAAQARQTAFAGRDTAHTTAQTIATETAANEFKASIRAADDDFAAGEQALPAEPKVKAKKAPTTAQKATSNQRSEGLAALQRKREKAEATAGEARETSESKLLDAFASVARSASGATLADADLAWILSASAGSSAVAQSLADVAAKGGMALAKGLVGTKDVPAHATICLDLLAANFPAPALLDAAVLLNGAPAAVRPWLLGLDPTVVKGAIGFANSHPTALATVAQVQPVLGTGTVASDFVEAMQKVKAVPIDIGWLLGFAATPGDGFKVLCRTIRNNGTPIPKIRAFHTAAGARFTLAEVATMIERNRDALVTATAAVAEADDHATSYVDLVVAATSKEPLSLGLKVALRAEALLRDAARVPVAPAVTVTGADVAYYGKPAFQAANAANDARTGFLSLGFPSGPDAEVHTHWNSRAKNIGKISSMHVQDAAGNGAELEKWPTYFNRLPQAIVDAHNNSAIRPSRGITLSLP